MDTIHSGHRHSSSGIDSIQESPPICQNIAPTLFVVFVTARNLHCIVSVHVVKNVITSSMINAQSRPQPWFRQLLCLRSALIFGCAQYRDVCLQEFGIVTRSRIRVHLRDHRTHREDLCLAAAGCLAGIWAPLPLGVPFFVGMCALTPFVCAYLTQYKTSQECETALTSQ